MATTLSSDDHGGACGRRAALAISLALLPLAALVTWIVLAGMASAAATGGCGGG